MIPYDRSEALRAEYRSRINRVIDYIDRNIGRELRLEELARTANFSRYHFHRIFGALTGETLNAFIQRRRAELAAGALIVHPKSTITEIALEYGYSGSDVFARAFKERFGMSASEWRAGGSEAWRKNRQAKGKPGQTEGKIGQEFSTVLDDDEGDRISSRRSFMDKSKFKVEVREVPALTVAYVRHVGPFPEMKRAYDKLMQWAGPRGLLRFPETKVLGIYHDNPEITETDKLRSDACITVPPETKVEGEVGKMTVPGGLFAVAYAEVGVNEFGEAWNALMRDWLPGSGYQPDDRMCYELCLNDPKDHPEGKFIIEIHEPIRPL
ncbi:MAG: AraC family transcriptional regulator [Candidatus Aminicenantes bacterium]|nr:AraC family transcriptional regulator [Candidatus Aminicenantes bacterium]